MFVHVCTPLPEHCVAPSVQLPLQTPFTQVPLGQLCPVPHMALPPQVCTSAPMHCVEVGVHWPVQLSLLQMYWQSVGASHVPDALQVCCIVVPEHCVVPGVQLPVQAPMTHAWLEHAEPAFCHAPAAVHSSGC